MPVNAGGMRDLVPEVHDHRVADLQTELGTGHAAVEGQHADILADADVYACRLRNDRGFDDVRIGIDVVNQGDCIRTDVRFRECGHRQSRADERERCQRSSKKAQRDRALTFAEQCRHGILSFDGGTVGRDKIRVKRSEVNRYGSVLRNVEHEYCSHACAEFASRNDGETILTWLELEVDDELITILSRDRPLTYGFRSSGDDNVIDWQNVRNDVEARDLQTRWTWPVGIKCEPHESDFRYLDGMDRLLAGRAQHRNKLRRFARLDFKRHFHGIAEAFDQHSDAPPSRKRKVRAATGV